MRLLAALLALGLTSVATAQTLAIGRLSDAPGLAAPASTPAVYTAPPKPPAPDFRPRVVLVTRKHYESNLTYAINATYLSGQPRPDPNNGWRMEARAFGSMEEALAWLNPGEGYGTRLWDEEVIGLWELGEKRDLVLTTEEHSEPVRIESRTWKTTKWEVRK